ncbi:hypothetical protein GCM10010289_07400 [Streptomyces violascens]|uniref:Rhamnogalacturonan I lyase beta-sheet domain-containing protein n=1 Tax=Streptomyces violascens TaxID=67381 RepID=A0ABQ3QGK9_9ACTN|nr:hypothetical protein GCM10010289_07400 [Streptomyces violascens]GHI36405.1 hypothetical protein Sviol_08130 [Streptomyces violascens]
MREAATDRRPRPFSPGGTSREAPAPPPQTPSRLGRGGKALVSQRWLGTGPDNVSFNVYRAGTKVNPAPINRNDQPAGRSGRGCLPESREGSLSRRP